jgi:hypothetical protein
MNDKYVEPQKMFYEKVTMDEKDSLLHDSIKILL